MVYGYRFDMIIYVRSLMTFFMTSNNIDSDMDHLCESHLIFLENHCNVTYGIKFISCGSVKKIALYF